MRDLIDRQAAIDAAIEAINEWGGGWDAERETRDAINTLPSAQPEPQWIPCSERLPEPENEGQRRGFYLTTNEFGSVVITRYEFYDNFQKPGWQRDVRIDAWMPLPEPWRGEQE